MQRKRVSILVFDEVEVLDFCGPFEVFSVARLDEERRREDPSPFDVFLVAQAREPVRASGGLRVLPDHDFDSCPRPDVFVAPGGWGTRKEVNNERLIAFVREAGLQAETLTSVCTGSFLLARAGLLDGRRTTTHWRSLDRMRDTFPGVTVERDLHVVEDGNRVTSAGISAGIDMALRVVARYFGEAAARAAARHMEYPFPDSNARRV